MFEPLVPAPAYLRLSEAIRDRILGRDLKPGELLPTETELARQFAVNRSTVREAIRQLESQGLVARKPGGKRLAVSRPSAASVTAGFTDALTLGDVRFTDVWEALQRIEPAIAGLAASRRGAGELDRLERVAGQFNVRAQAADGAVEQVAEFFLAMGAATGNPVLVLVNEPLVRLLKPCLAVIIDRVPQARKRIAAAQQRLVGAVKGRDTQDAEAWMAKHVRDFRRGYELAGIPVEVTVGSV